MASANPLRISVVICTYNPRRDYLHRTLSSLECQTLKPSDYELIVIDNNSAESVAEFVDLKWHPNARCVIEPSPGVINARMRGIRESRGHLIVFVDDDNVLREDYLDRCVNIADTFQQLGVFGGQIAGEFEREPTADIRPYLGMLAIRTVQYDRWSNDKKDRRNPVGAGMCVTRLAADAWVADIEQRHKNDRLGSEGRNTIRGEDDDICFSARSRGFGVGEFQQLELKHLIPADRLSLDYLSSLYEGMVYSGLVLGHIWGVGSIPDRPTLRQRLGILRQQLRMSDTQRRMSSSKMRGEEMARLWLAERETRHLTDPR